MGKYNIIYADPAWSYDKKVGQGIADDVYTTMTTEDIMRLPIQSIAAEDCFLFLWATFPMLKDALKTIEAWGFEYKTLGFSWIKTNRRQDLNQASFFPLDTIDTFFGIGHYTKSNCEVCLIGKRGNPKVVSNSVSSVVVAPIGKHSKKPNEVRDKIVQLCGDLPRVELFARQNYEGWDAWGNEVDKSISFCGEEKLNFNKTDLTDELATEHERHSDKADVMRSANCVLCKKSTAGINVSYCDECLMQPDGNS